MDHRHFDTAAVVAAAFHEGWPRRYKYCCCHHRDLRGRGQQFQGPGFRVFGQNLIKISTNAHSKQHLFAIVLSSRWR